MIDVLNLYDLAAEDGIPVYWFNLEQAESLSFNAPDGTCAIAMDPWHLVSVTEEKVKLAHELGHCETGSFYNRWAMLDVRQKHENRADKWAIRKLVPESDLDRALRDGHTELWDLAEQFGVTEDFMQKAVWYYRHGNLAVGA